MAIPVWPLGLPSNVLQSGYTESYPNNLLRYEPDSGIAKVRRKSGLVSWPMSVTFVLNKEQKALFESFVTDTLIMGSLRFSFKHPTKCTDVEVRMVSGQDSLFSFVPFGFSLFKVSFKLEVLP